jgi:prophage antirepressor-like protein
LIPITDRAKKGDFPMSNEISVFTFENVNVRIIDRDGNLWFVAKDVCDVLGYENARDAVAKHCRDDVANRYALNLLDRNGRPHETTIISELNLNRLIMRSKKPEAEKFQDWVCGEVIPSIRKTGQYSVSPEPNEQQPKLLKYWIDGYLYEFPANQPVKSVCRAKSGATTFHFFGEEKKPTKKEKNALAKESPKPEPMDSHPADLLKFFKENCKVIPDHWVCSDDLYNHYLEWAKDNSVERSYGKIHFFRWLNKIFGKDVVRRQYRSKIGKERFWTYTGIALVEEDPFDPPESPPAPVPTPAESAPSLKFPPPLPRSGPPLRHFRPPV